MFLKIVLVIGALIGSLALYGFLQYKNTGIDLAQAENWLHFSGAQITSGGIHFTPLNNSIVHQDGSAGQPNPSVNVNGQHLKVGGDFKITAIVSNIDKQASFRLYTMPPIVYDQWRYEPPSIDITIDAIKNSITARVWDGISSNSMDMRTYAVFLTPKITISLEHINSQINIIQNGRILGSMPDHAIFDSGTVWFGADGDWTLATLRAKPLGAGQVEVVSPSLLTVEKNNKNSLRNLADANPRKLKIGTAVNTSLLFSNEQYKNLALGEFSILTPENSMKPQFIHPMPNVYDFAQADQLVGAALKNNIAVHGHVLVYHKSSPDWMVKSPKEDRQKIMADHIQTVVNHFKGKVAEWDVVNEPFSKKNALYKNGGTGLEPNIWFEAMGEEYIDLAFKTARAADPSAKLYLNDYALEHDDQHWDSFLALVKRLKERGVPIDGVGFESHIYGDGDYINADQLKKHMAALAKLGLLTRISEIDVTGDDAKEQVNQYVTALDVCLRAPNCTSYTTWGITDLYGSTTRSDRYPLVYGTSLLWDKDFKPKPAYSALQQKLEQ